MLRGREAAKMQTSRAEWTERVAQWQRSGLDAKEFAGSIGVDPMGLRQWGWRLGREARAAARRAEAARGAPAAAWVEITAAGSTDLRFELELGNGRRLRIPARFDASALERLLGVLEAR
jgi:hypothetical protein